MRVEGGLIGPQLEQDKRIGAGGALQDLVLLAARFLRHGAAAIGQSPGELGALAGLGLRGDDETDGHGRFLSCGA
jgi:hypothetical protein